MARPTKSNLYYFPLDVDFFEDPKTLSIEETCGVKGGYVAIRLMAMVYQTNGWYLEWPEKFEVIVAKRVGNGVTGAFVMDVLKSCLKHGLFHKETFDQKGIITSRGIQKRWKMVMEQLRRTTSIKAAENSDCWFISSEETPVSSEITTVSSEKTPVSSAISTQKENEKENVNEKENSVPVAEATTPGENFSLPSGEKRKRNAGPRRGMLEKPTIEQVRAYFVDRIGDPKDPRSWPLDKCYLNADKYLDHYTSVGWTYGKSRKPIVDWKAAVRIWIRKEIEDSNQQVWQPAPKTEAPAPVIAPKPKSCLSKLQMEINYLFERFQEDADMVTVISIDGLHYNLLKNSGLINFDDDIVQDIRSQALQKLNDTGQAVNDDNLKNLMKKFGVLEFFKMYGKEGKQAVFYEPQFTNQ